MHTQVILCSNNHRVLRPAKKSNQFTTLFTLPNRNLRANWIGDPECVDDDGYPLVDENGSTLVPVPRDGPLDEPEASSLSAWARGYRESRNNLRDSIAGRGYGKPALSRFRMKVRTTLFAKKQPRRDRNVRTLFRDKNRKNMVQSVSQELN